MEYNRRGRGYIFENSTSDGTGKKYLDYAFKVITTVRLLTLVMAMALHCYAPPQAPLPPHSARPLDRLNPSTLTLSLFDSPILP